MMLSLLKAGEVISPVFMRFLQPFGLTMVTVEEDIGHDGASILRAKLIYGPGAPKPNGRALLDAMVEAEAALKTEGDQRSLLIQPSYSDGVPADDPFASPGRRRKRA